MNRKHRGVESVLNIPVVPVLCAGAMYRKFAIRGAGILFFLETIMASFDYSRSNKRWQAVRLLALRRDKFRCRDSARYGKVVEATTVHHIWPAEDYPEYAYCLWNLISLSAGAHDQMHDRKTRKLTAKGIAWKNRTPPPSDTEK